MRVSTIGCLLSVAFCLGPVATAGVAYGADAGEQSLSDLARRILLDNLPKEIAGDNDWGQQRQVTSGLKFDRDNGRLRIQKRTKEVNDGLWTNYRVTLVDPTQNLHVRLAGLRRVGAGRLAFQLFLSARVEGKRATSAGGAG